MNVFIAQEIKGDFARLTSEDSYHCFRVLRKTRGQGIDLIDGSGYFYQGIIEFIDKEKCELRITGTHEEPASSFHLHMAVAPTKNISRFEWFIEKAVEIGIHEITPLICAHSERNKVPHERMGKIIRSAVKQSQRARFPVLHPTIKLSSFMKQSREGHLLVAHQEEAVAHLSRAVVPDSQYTILIGPEGDFSEQELSELRQSNWKPVVLGNNRLRTETAAVVAVQIINGIHF